LKKSILFIISNFLNGGAEKNLVRVINNLSDEHYSISVLCLQNIGHNVDLLKPGVNIIDINSPSIYSSIFKIQKVIKKNNPDIIFGWMGYINAYMSFFIPLFSKKIIWYCRESGLPSFVNEQQRFPWLFKYFYKTSNRYHLIICQSHRMKKDFQDNFGVLPQKMMIINNPIDFLEIEKNKTFVLKKDEGKFHLLYVGGLRVEKRVELLIEVLALLPEKYKLTIVGSGNQYDKVIAAIDFYQIQSRIEIIFDCYNPVPYYQASDCLLLASAFEGFPNVVIEAFACGCPAIGFNSEGGTNEALENYGGFSLTNAKMQEFADKIISVCEYENLDRENIIRNCKEKYDISKVIAVYNSILL
jgi:glycosyltransferase involved in cell wall biosynthesis